MPPFDVNQLDYWLIAPQLILLALIFVAWGLDLILPTHLKAGIGWVCAAGLVVATGAAVLQWGIRDDFAGVLRIDEYSVFFTVLFLLSAIGIMLISMRYADRFLPQSGEFYGLVLAGTLGMVLMASANELLTAYLSLELLSFSSYVLVAYAKTNFKSNEAGMKYIVLGAFSSALLLYGISLVYGTLGTTYFPQIADNIDTLGVGVPGFGVGLCLVFAGLGFKIAAVPFHMWTPDVYEGAPTPVTAYLSVASKAAGFALILRFLVGALYPMRDQYAPLFALLAVLTMTLGNLVAIQQKNVKRMLAYSSIGQAGYVIAGLAALAASVDIAEQATRGMLLHLAGYYAANLAVFGGFIAFQVLRNGREQMTDMAGFARQAPFAALAMMCGLFSLAGMPLFAGFVTKFYLFAAIARAGLLWLVAIAVINSTISLYYYLLLVHQMYVRTPPGYDGAEVNGHGQAALQAATPAPVPALAVPAGASGAVAVGAMPSSAADGPATGAGGSNGFGVRRANGQPSGAPAPGGQLAGADAHGHAVDAGHGDG
ncbi:MAG TPA: NADH-quinone oxidoreductase subunit NuoN, partial [Chloroflexota bacterium]|nr:NADH-quinone oxidoreductase subunit NuoN [Chloroflexota bacterium]